jgi:hypothetical protein
VQRGKKLTLTDNARIYSEASGDRLATGKDTTLVEMAVLGLIEANGAVFSSSRDPAFDHYLDDQQPGPQAGDHYGLRFDNLVATRAGYGYTGVEGALSEIKDTEFKYGEVGIAIENQAAPSLSGLSFNTIVDNRHILLDSTDVFVPYAVKYDSCAYDTCWTQTQTIWDLEGGTHVVARNGMRAGQDSNIGVTGKDDLIVGGKLFAQGASGDTVYFRPETVTSGADGWGGITVDNGYAKGGVIEYADISYAENPLFVFYPDSSWALRHSRIHHFAETGLWVDGAVGQGGVIESNTIERGSGLLLTLGRTGRAARRSRRDADPRQQDRPVGPADPGEHLVPGARVLRTLVLWDPGRRERFAGVRRELDHRARHIGKHREPLRDLLRPSVRRLAEADLRRQQLRGEAECCWAVSAGERGCPDRLQHGSGQPPGGGYRTR